MSHIKVYILLFIFTLLFFHGNSVIGADAGLNGYYSIHNGSYREKKNAEAYIASIERTGMPAFIEKVDLKEKGIWYMVYVGRYDDINSAKKAIIFLKKSNIHDLGFIKRFPAKQPQAIIPVKKTTKNIDRDIGDSKKKEEKIRLIKTKAQETQVTERQAAKKIMTSEKPRIMFLEGKALQEKGNFTGALNQYLEISNKYPGWFDKELVQYLKTMVAALTDKYYAKGDYKTVGDLYFKTIGKVRLADDFSTGLKIGKSLQRLGLYKEAADVFSNLREDNNGELALAVAELNIFMGNSEMAEQKLDLLAKKRPPGNNKEMLQNVREKLADLYLVTGDYAKAAAIYEEVIKSGSQKRDAVFYLHYGRLLQAKKMTREAFKNYKAALGCCGSRRGSCKNNVLSEIYIGVGDIDRALGKFNDGVAMYNKALEYADDEQSKKWLLLRIGQAYRG